MAKGDICEAYGEWDDRAQAFRVYLARGDENGNPDLDAAAPMRQFSRCVGSRPDPAEARLVWAAMIHCPKDLEGSDVHGEAIGFAREAQARRVASRVAKEIKAIRQGKPLLHGLGAQIACVAAGAKRAPQFAIDNLRGKIHGAP